MEMEGRYTGYTWEIQARYRGGMGQVDLGGRLDEEGGGGGEEFREEDGQVERRWSGLGFGFGLGLRLRSGFGFGFGFGFGLRAGLR